MSARPALVAAGVVALTFASAQITQSQNKYTFKIKWEKGRTYTYKMTMKVTDAGKPVTRSYNHSMTVKDLAKGVATLSLKSDAPGSPKEPQTAKVNSHGKVIQGPADFSLSFAPTGPIKVGHKWTEKSGKDESQVRSDFVFNGPKTVNGKKFIEITVKTEASQPTGNKVTGSGTLLYTPSDGMLHRFTYAAKSTQNGKISPIETTLTRVK